jgi:Leucine-rich repeat (LRR) protein
MGSNETRPINGALRRDRVEECLRKNNRIIMTNKGVLAIQSNAFSNFEAIKLIEIDLSWNQIRQISADTFRGLSNLEALKLNKNEIGLIEAGSFRTLKKLKSLNLSDNHLKAITRKTFSGLENLETLGLSKNQIGTIEAGSFQRLAQLKILELWSNKLTSLDETTFVGLVELEALFLFSNPVISSLDYSVFSHLPSLKYLYIINFHANSISKVNKKENDYRLAIETKKTLQVITLNMYKIASDKL